MTPRTLDALLRGLVDYAGLFPPSAHNMAETVARYARYRRSPQACALGRLVVPAPRLIECEQSVAALLRRDRGEGRWRLTALVTPGARKELEAVAAFNERQPGAHQLDARVECIEMKAEAPEDVRRAAAAIPPAIEAFYECQPGESLGELLSEVKAVGAGAKIRTGGLVPGAIAAPSSLAEFIARCVSAGIPFKATAGLHHPVRAEHALTYEPDSPRAVTNGFLNVFVGATLAFACGLDARGLLPVLEEMSPSSFHFTETALAWHDLSADLEHVRKARELARSFGSCSFEEPIADLAALGWRL